MRTFQSKSRFQARCQLCQNLHVQKVNEPFVSKLPSGDNYNPIRRVLRKLLTNDQCLFSAFLTCPVKFTERFSKSTR